RLATPVPLEAAEIVIDRVRFGRGRLRRLGLRYEVRRNGHLRNAGIIHHHHLGLCRHLAAVLTAPREWHEHGDQSELQQATISPPRPLHPRLAQSHPVSGLYRMHPWRLADTTRAP